MYRNRDPRARRRATEEELLADLAPGGARHNLVRAGGPCDRRARTRVARRDGDKESLRALETKDATE